MSVCVGEGGADVSQCGRGVQPSGSCRFCPPVPDIHRSHIPATSPLLRDWRKRPSSNVHCEASHFCASGTDQKNKQSEGAPRVKAQIEAERQRWRGRGEENREKEKQPNNYYSVKCQRSLRKRRTEMRALVALRRGSVTRVHNGAPPPSLPSRSFYLHCHPVF
ncbi:unnamed protein product [Pleuronectes platessa]|uniref:Uncharacterized protein n=1 Tax=Pleuronectes platessa TaxID=8262 RepID=A0A9N7YRP1_PLEPL|nr:unnamed protein product [Pleuronectes platessa]